MSKPLLLPPLRYCQTLYSKTALAQEVVTPGKGAQCCCDTLDTRASMLTRLPYLPVPIPTRVLGEAPHQPQQGAPATRPADELDAALLVCTQAAGGDTSVRTVRYGQQSQTSHPGRHVSTSGS